MNLEDERRLKFDRRLRTRRGLVSAPEVAGYEASLPDVSHKIAPNDGSTDASTPPAAGGSAPTKTSS